MTQPVLETIGASRRVAYAPPTTMLQIGAIEDSIRRNLSSTVILDEGSVTNVSQTETPDVYFDVFGAFSKDSAALFPDSELTLWNTAGDAFDLSQSIEGTFVYGSASNIVSSGWFGLGSAWSSDYEWSSDCSALSLIPVDFVITHKRQASVQKSRVVVSFAQARDRATASLKVAEHRRSEAAEAEARVVRPFFEDLDAPTD